MSDRELPCRCVMCADKFGDSASTPEETELDRLRAENAELRESHAGLLEVVARGGKRSLELEEALASEQRARVMAEELAARLGYQVLERVAAVDAVRESCAKLLDSDRLRCGTDCDAVTCAEPTCVALRRIAAAIRARK